MARSAVAWIGAIAFASSLCMGAEIQHLPEENTAGHRHDEQVVFDIAPQPLVMALRAYSETTGIAVLVDDAQTVGRNSPGVTGRFDVTAALRRLLEGTGLTPSYASNDAFTLVPDPKSSGPASAETAQVATGTVDIGAAYAARLQASIEAALCRTERTRPGRFRLALQLWIDASGRVRRTELLNSAGSDDLDGRIVAIMNGLDVGVPPAELPEPLTILLLPRAPDAPYDCRRATQGTNHGADA
ncbi:STN domain-containing protein [Luteibacter rhizovicinus]|uniref:STN domain-containing protein n=1 Tax=Luteibacter rhizovicinus TaxID=242606 RepID=UPI00104A24FB|nr:STN domain-containing protein [Luteibacter rhizovicinus]